MVQPQRPHTKLDLNTIKYDNYFSDNGKLIINYNANSAKDASGTLVPALADDDTVDDKFDDTQTASLGSMVFFEDADNSGIFTNTDDKDDSNLDVSSAAKRGTTATFDYNDSAQSFVVSNDFGTIDMDESAVGVEWNSGELLVVTVVDQDLNLNTLSDEDMAFTNAYNATIPSMTIGSPITLEDSSDFEGAKMKVSAFNKIAYITSPSTDKQDEDVSITFPDTVAELRALADGSSFIYVNFDLESVATSISTVQLTTKDDSVSWSALTGLSADVGANKGFIKLGALAAVGTAAYEAQVIAANFTTADAPVAANGDLLYVDIFTFGDKSNNAIYRFLLEETGDNTATFVGEVEYIMLNQINNDLEATYKSLSTLSDDITIIVHEDLTDEDAPRISYVDLGADGVNTQISDQVEAPSHSGVVTFDAENYKTADTVVITLDDQDLNTDSDLIDVYITSSNDNVGESATSSSSYVLDVTFNDVKWKAAVVGTTAGSPDNGLRSIWLYISRDRC